MNLIEIRKERKRLEKEYEEAERKLDEIRFQMGQLQSQCPHKNMKYYTDMSGERDSYCPDCGKGM